MKRIADIYVGAPQTSRLDLRDWDVSNKANLDRPLDLRATKAMVVPHADDFFEIMPAAMPVSGVTGGDQDALARRNSSKAWIFAVGIGVVAAAIAILAAIGQTSLVNVANPISSPTTTSIPSTGILPQAGSNPTPTPSLTQSSGGSAAASASTPAPTPITTPANSPARCVAQLICL